MPQKSVRFSVRDNNGNRASTWKLFTHTGKGKHDVYLTCRPIGGVLKASLHQSGSWHIGFIRDFLKKNLDEGHPKHNYPYIERWPRPAEIGPGVTLAYRIVVPTSGVNVPIIEELPQSIAWISAAPNGKAVEVDIIFTRPDTVVSSWPGRNSMQTQLLGKLQLENQETVWLVHHVVDVPEFALPIGGKLTSFKSGRGVNLSDGNVRGLLFGSADDGSRFIVDSVFVADVK